LDLFLPDLGMKITGFALHERDGQRWVSLPSRPIPGYAGKPDWRPLLLFSDREAGKRFQRAALAAVAAYELAQVAAAPQAADVLEERQQEPAEGSR